MTIKVTGCSDCCLLANEGSGYYCNHPNMEDNDEQNHIKTENFIPLTPDWCPLNKEPITIEKE